MKKLLAIMGVLLVIFIGMYIYKCQKNKSTITAIQIENIQEYITKIYTWQELTGSALPEFDDINNAPDIWIWEVVKKNLEDYELTYDEIQQKANEIFGEDFKKQFPKDGTEFIYYDEETGKYFTSGMGLDTEEDIFLINEIKKTKKGYEVEIVEYLEDYGEAMEAESGEGEEPADEEIEYNVYIKNINGDTIATIKSTDSETKAIETVKKNIDRFSTKTVYLKVDRENIYVESVQ